MYQNKIIFSQSFLEQIHSVDIHPLCNHVLLGMEKSLKIF